MRSALCLVALAGCLDSSVAPTSDPTPPPRLKKAQDPSWVFVEESRPKPPVEKLDAETELRAPIREGRLALIPIVSATESSQQFITLKAGIASGSVSAVDSGVVDHIQITNRSDRPLAILGGELVVGGHQDRLIVSNVVIPPHRSQSVTTVCAELGRTDGPTLVFHAAAGLAEPTLRNILRGGADQFAVWDRIGVLTGTISDSYRFAAAKQHGGAAAERLRHLTDELDRVDRVAERTKTVGFAVAVDDKVIAIERFATPELFRDLRATVIASYLPSSAGKPRSEAVIGPSAVRAFRERTGAGAPVPPRSPAGAPSAARSARP